MQRWRPACTSSQSWPRVRWLSPGRPDRVQATTVLIELAEICGLARLPVEGRRPMEATTYGVGMSMEEAIERGYADLVVGVGGSASTDGGMGAAAALGARILDARGEPVRPCGSGLAEVASVDLDPMLALLEGVSLVVATDVESPLAGSNGAAPAFGAQKGASRADRDPRRGTAALGGSVAGSKRCRRT